LAAALLDSLFEQPAKRFLEIHQTSFSVRHNHQRTSSGRAARQFEAGRVKTVTPSGFNLPAASDRMIFV
jgi:hypothetical protein